MKRIRAKLRRGALGLLTAGALAVVPAACGISTAQEVQIGQQYAAQVNQQLPMVQNAAALRYINSLGNRLAANGRRNLEWHFYIVNSKEVNAFALPGGYVYVNRGLIENTSNLAELAGVVAHEISHVELRHGAEQIQRMQAANVGAGLASILLGNSAVANAGIQVAGTAILANYSRGDEAAADENAVPLMVKTGIDPHGLVSMFQELLREQQTQPSAVEQWFSTHPTTEGRIQDVQKVIARYPNSASLPNDAQAYHQFVSQVRSYPAAPSQ